MAWQSELAKCGNSRHQQWYHSLFSSSLSAAAGERNGHTLLQRFAESIWTPFSEATAIPALLSIAATPVLQRVRQIMQASLTSKRFDRLAKTVELLSLQEGKASFKMKVDESHLNGVGTLHGGMTAFLVDNLTTGTVLTKPPHLPGVSIDMSISYLRAAPVGEEITINTEVVKMGRTLAFTSAELLNKDGKLIAKASHTKFIGQGRPAVKSE